MNSSKITFPKKDDSVALCPVSPLAFTTGRVKSAVCGGFVWVGVKVGLKIVLDAETPAPLGVDCERE